MVAIDFIKNLNFFYKKISAYYQRAMYGLSVGMM